MTQNTLQSGHDAPVSDRSGDFYDRWPVARSISSIIATAPREWSTRIGLFGPWGDGKTTVLNFVEQQQRDAGNIVIRYAPWGATTPDEVWKDFGKALIAGLKRHGVKLSPWAQTVHWAKAIGPTKIKTGVTAAGKLAEASGHVPGAAAGATVASSLIGEKLTFTKEDMLRLIEQLGTRRVVVFIDDLDRTDASVVPKLLLVLRELLDFAQFAFVLAFDRRIVATALERGNQSWDKSGESFLDKVIDFRVDLPKPTADQVRRLALDQFGRLCSFVPTEAVEAVATLLPTNPRKLKLLARMIASTKREVDRHEGDELDWHVILLLALIRTESESLASRLLALTTEDHEYDFNEGYEGQKDTEARRKEELNNLMGEFPELTLRQERIEQLVKAWRAQVPAHRRERTRYQASFALTPHCITWGEFRQFFSKWRSDKRRQVIVDFVGERISASEARPESVQGELSMTALAHYATVLEEASHVLSKSSHQACIGQANDSIDLLLECVTGPTPVCEPTQEQLLKLWDRLNGVARQWRHFNGNDGEPELRAREVQTLISLGDAVGDPMLIYDKLRPGYPDEDAFSARDAGLQKEMSDALHAAFGPKARVIALSYVATPGQLGKLRSSDERRGARYLLTAPASSLFHAHKPDLMAALEARRSAPGVAEDASDYLGLLLSALVHGDQNYCTADDRRTFIKEHQDFMCLIWSLCVSEPSQFRMLQDLYKQRVRLIEAGIPDADLTLPDWLKARPVR